MDLEGMLELLHRHGDEELQIDHLIDGRWYVTNGVVQAWAGSLGAAVQVAFTKLEH